MLNIGHKGLAYAMKLRTRHFRDQTKYLLGPYLDMLNKNKNKNHGLCKCQTNNP